jgi:hypothetical protein
LFHSTSTLQSVAALLRNSSSLAASLNHKHFIIHNHINHLICNLFKYATDPKSSIPVTCN